MLRSRHVGVLVGFIMVSLFWLLSRNSLIQNKLANTLQIRVNVPLIPVMLQASLSPAIEEPSKILYLIQTESCLSENYRSLNVFGNCQCDVLVLSFKHPCTDKSPPHIQYIFENSETSWTSGRNLLYRTAMEREKQYLYYSFLDDDIDMKFNDKKKTGSPWREYEESLKRVQPAVAASWWSVTGLFWEFYQGKCSNYPESIEFLPFFWFDAMCSSFHYKVINHLLPYYEKMDRKSIWYSQLYLIMKTNLLFPEQIFLQMNVIALNGGHEPDIGKYPRVMYSGSTVHAFKEDLLNEIPQKYRKEMGQKLDDWAIDLIKHQVSAPVPCPVIPNVTYIPFSYLSY